LLQLTVFDWLPEVTVTCAVFVPTLLYALLTDLAVLESESVPLHLYVYEPVPPDGLAVHVALPPLVMLVGETVHEAASTG